jgi:tetrapyrrole methylase family protein/MazG family protein
VTPPASVDGTGEQVGQGHGGERRVGDRPRVVVVGLGPAGPDLADRDVLALLATHPGALLRTRRHPAAEGLGHVASLDHLYGDADRFERLYARMAEEVCSRAAALGEVLFAVPGSPLVAERTVELLRARSDIDLVVRPALSFVDLAWDRLGIDPIAAGVTLLDAAPTALAGRVGPLLLAQCWSREILSEIKLAPEESPPARATLLHHLGLPDEQVVEVAWSEVDRTLEPDHLTALYVPAWGSAVGAAFLRLEELARELRARCPWDREQTPQSLVGSLREEAFEVIEALEELGADGEGADHLAEELGDLLYQVVIQARMAAEAGLFTLSEVADGVAEKLVRRHPHVFGDAERPDAEAVARAWDADKRREKGRASALDGVPAGLPALAWAATLYRRADRAGLVADRPAGVAADERELGEQLFELVARAAEADLDPEAALRRAVRTRVAAWRRREEAAGSPAGDRPA